MCILNLQSAGFCFQWAVDAIGIHTHTEQITETPAALASHCNGMLLAIEHMHERMSLCWTTSTASKPLHTPYSKVSRVRGQWSSLLGQSRVSTEPLKHRNLAGKDCQVTIIARWAIKVKYNPSDQFASTLKYFLSALSFRLAASL